MPNSHSVEDLFDFLNHASERGLMPAATAQALAVATRNVFAVLEDNERANLPIDDIDAVIRRFDNKRARDFSPASLKEYGRRVKRAIELYLRWKEDPSNFGVKTRATSSNTRRDWTTSTQSEFPAPRAVHEDTPEAMRSSASGYQTAFPVRPGQVVTVSNIPHDLTVAEAERLAQFIRLLAPG
jgi:hypothetical protein